MRQRSVFVIAPTGEVITVDSLSVAAIHAKVTFSDVVGKKFWHWHDESNGETIRRHISECLFGGEPVEFELTSKVSGFVEHWIVRMTLIPPHRNILCVATQRFPGVVAKLSQRQRELLRMLAGDETFPEIADRLGVTETALHHRLQTIRKKLGVRTNHGLMVAAGRHGLLT